MANNENLIQNTDRSPSKAREEDKKNGKDGGIESGKVRSKQKSYKEIFELLQECPVNKDKTISIQAELVPGSIVSKDVNLIDYLVTKYPNLSSEEITNATFASIKMLELIDHPDAKVAIKAFEVVRDTSGQKPVDKQDIAHSGTMVANYSVSPATEAATLKAQQKREKIDE